MSHELWMWKDKSTITNITPLVGNISWSSHVDQLGQQLNFNTAFNDDIYFPINPLDLGKRIFLINNGLNVYDGFIFTEKIEGRESRNYNSFDGAFYLNESKEIYQFNKVIGVQAILKILQDYQILVGNIAPIQTLIDKLYINKTPAEIIKDILLQAEKETGKKYSLEMRAGKLFIEERKEISGFSITVNNSDLSNVSRKRTIEDMKNSIKIISNESVIAEVKNDNLIAQYGLLQEVQTIENKDIAQAKNIAKNLLKDLGKIFEDNSFEMLGNDNIRAGRLINISEPFTGMTGTYLIKSVNHTVSENIHRMKVNLGVV